MRLIHCLFLLLLTWPLLAQEETADELNNPTNETEASVITDSNAINETSENLPEQADNTELAIKRVMPEPAKRRLSEVIKYLGLLNRETEIVKFDDAESSISGLYLPENTGKPQGGILILHDIDQHAHWPFSVGPLREYLPDYGWNTLSLFFGNYISKPLPKIPDVKPAPLQAPDTQDSEETSTELTNTAIDTDTDLNEAQEVSEPILSQDDENFDSQGSSDNLDAIADSFDPASLINTQPTEEITAEASLSDETLFMQSMAAKVEGGLQQLNTLGQFNLVVVAHGLSANWAVETLRERIESSGNTLGYSLILVDAQTSRYPNYPLNDELAKLSIPILDLITQNSPALEWQHTARRNSVVRAQNANYQQIEIPSLTTIHTSKHNMVSRRVRGWLKTHAAGEEVKVRERRG